MDKFVGEESIWLLQNTSQICQFELIMGNVIKQNPGDICSLSSGLKSFSKKLWYYWDCRDDHYIDN